MDAESIAQKMRMAGIPLVHFPCREGGVTHDGYVNAAAVTYVSASDADENQDVSVVYGIKGGIHDVRSMNTAEEWQALRGSMLAAKKMVECRAEQATSHNKTGSTYLDPEMVTRIHDTGYQVVVIYGGDRIDLTARPIDINDVMDHDPNDKRSLNDIFAEAGQRKAAQERAARGAIIDKVAAQNNRLVSLPSGSVHYINPDEISYMHVTDDPGDSTKKGLHISMKAPPLIQSGERLTVTCESSEVLAEIVGRLTKARSSHAVQGGSDVPRTNERKFRF